MSVHEEEVEPQTPATPRRTSRSTAGHRFQSIITPDASASTPLGNHNPSFPATNRKQRRSRSVASSAGEDVNTTSSQKSKKRTRKTAVVSQPSTVNPESTGPRLEINLGQNSDTENSKVKDPKPKASFEPILDYFDAPIQGDQDKVLFYHSRASIAARPTVVETGQIETS
ncbi:uncharacterized protein MELLADRAFT_90546 [Melampsora larici-populina 98AG31]|uniref:Uncharacterized protein n=1 Tax=Melampsora larici-populina (strain 98AG31 / pathotype 3-4-7) TaxID=747676 RepID=F4RXA8_MELLP|nr:uncharacterized protein MELLADRAFT_90546 [Melampsora larici-populina 98AG31]EGG02934.1 hypothetical protein MELLADRAFT_90546 [Melampsora larici-populina 98AG31]